MENLLIVFGAKYLIILLALLTLAYLILLNKGKRKEVALFGVILLPLTYLVAKLASTFYYSSRPFVVGHFTPLISHAADNGFPSDHALFASALAALLYVFNKKWGLAAWIMTILIALSRVLAGVHHLADVVGSAIIAICMAYLVYKFIYPAISKKLLKN